MVYSWDVVCTVQLKSSLCGVALCSEQQVSEFQEYFRAGVCAQAVVVSWSGLVWCMREDLRCRIPSAMRDGCSRLVLERMVREYENRPVTHVSLISRDQPPPYTHVSRVPTQVSLLAQQVLAWLLRWDPRLVMVRPAAYHVSIPTRAFLEGGPFSCTALAFESHKCCLTDMRDI